jgi:flagellar basal body-associated protein FliL
MSNKKSIFIGIIIGAVVTATAYLGFVFFKQIRLIQTHEAAIVQIVNYLNEQAAAAPQVSQAPSQQ